MLNGMLLYKKEKNEEFRVLGQLFANQSINQSIK